MRGVTAYLFHNQLVPNEEILFHCQKCNRGMFKYSAEYLIIANVMGSKDIFMPGMTYIVMICHSCKTPHKILFQ